MTSLHPGLQYFWEAFPAGSGPTDRTTYCFTYLDAEPHRPSLAELMEDYWRLMPQVWTGDASMNQLAPDAAGMDQGLLFSPKP